MLFKTILELGVCYSLLLAVDAGLYPMQRSPVPASLLWHLPSSGSEAAIPCFPFSTGNEVLLVLRLFSPVILQLFLPVACSLLLLLLRRPRPVTPTGLLLFKNTHSRLHDPA